MQLFVEVKNQASLKEDKISTRTLCQRKGRAVTCSLSRDQLFLQALALVCVWGGSGQGEGGSNGEVGNDDNDDDDDTDMTLSGRPWLSAARPMSATLPPSLTSQTEPHPLKFTAAEMARGLDFLGPPLEQKLLRQFHIKQMHIFGFRLAKNGCHISVYFGVKPPIDMYRMLPLSRVCVDTTCCISKRWNLFQSRITSGVLHPLHPLPRKNTLQLIYKIETGSIQVRFYE